MHGRHRTKRYDVAKKIGQLGEIVGILYSTKNSVDTTVKNSKGGENSAAFAT